MINNAKTVNDNLTIQKWMSQVEATVQQAQVMQAGVGPSKPPQNEEAQDSNNDSTTIEIISVPMFGFDEEDMEDL